MTVPSENAMKKENVAMSGSITNGMPAGELGVVGWRKARRSNSGGNCVQLAALDSHPRGAGLVGMRDSKAPDGPVLIFTSEQAAAFVAGLKRGAFDRLLTGG